jgi:hypothetical protein
VTLVALAPGFTRAADKASIEPRERWSAVFGSSEVDFHFMVKTPQPLKGRAAWAFAVDKRVIQRGEAAVAADADNPATVAVPLKVPEVRDGVVLQAQITVSVYLDGRDQAELSQDKPVWIFPRDPFVDRSRWLKDLQITLFDPEGATAALLRKMKAPFTEARTVAALAAVKEGLLIVGEGTSFKDHRDLAAALLRAAARGLPVLCLAPAAGLLPVPGVDPRLPAPASLSWKRQDVIAQFDKRLDADSWPPDGKLIASAVSQKALDGTVIGEFTSKAEDWPWMEAVFAEKRGRLVVCGFAIIGKWESGPTPRYLFARILDHLAGTNADSTER